VWSNRKGYCCKKCAQSHFLDIIPSILILVPEKQKSVVANKRKKVICLMRDSSCKKICLHARPHSRIPMCKALCLKEKQAKCVVHKELQEERNEQI
jgi:hypothetical protein